VEFDRAITALAARRAECTDDSDKFLEHLNGVLVEMVAVQQISDPYRKLKVMAGYRRGGKSSTRREGLKGWGISGKGRGNAWGGKDNLSDIKDNILDVNQAMADALDEVTNLVLIELSRLVAIETVKAAEQRRAEGGLEFHDLLVLARNMLRTQPAARQALHERYPRILLDEFQDTDPIQIELAVLIATSATDVEGVAWPDLPVEPGRLFFVGDPKQSIYRFRRADISLFLRARDLFVAGDQPVSLTTNFRTVEPIVDWVNAFFTEHMAVEQAGLQPAYVKLDAHRESSGRDHRPVLLGGEHEDPKINSAGLREAEADDVAAAIAAILAEPHAWPVFDEDQGQFRDARLQDITILVPTRTSLPYLRAALDQADIRYRIATGTLAYHTQEVRDALAAIKAIDDPTDEISLVAALRSPLYCCSDVDLFTFFQGGGRWDLRRPVPDGVAADHPVRHGIEHLRSLWLERWWLTPSGLLERLLRERRAAMLAFGNPRPADVWRRLRFLVDQARGFEEAGGGDLRAFTQWAELQGAAKARVHEPLLPETDEEALSIQTIHGSKGLEFPITILSGMTTLLDSARRGVSVLWDDDGQPSVKIRSGVETRNHEPRADLEGTMDLHEKLRLAYVATTRARDHLLVSCHHKAGTGEKSWAGLFFTTFDAPVNRELWRRMPELRTEPEVTSRAEQVGFPLDDRDQWVAERQQLLATAHVPRVMSATGVAQAAARVVPVGNDPDLSAQSEGEQFVLADQDDDRFDQPDDGVITRRRGRIGSAVGTAVHAVLELVDLVEPTDVDTHISQQCQAAGIPTLVPVVTRLVQAALESASVELAATTTHHKELYLAAPLGDRVIEGYVDLLIDTPDGLIVVDYKTDAVSSDAQIEARLAAYELQAASYAVALETVTDRPVIDARFIFCRATGAVERSVTDLPAAKARVRAALEPSAQ